LYNSIKLESYSLRKDLILFQLFFVMFKFSNQYSFTYFLVLLIISLKEVISGKIGDIKRIP